MGVLIKISTLKEKECEIRQAEETITQLGKLIKTIRKQRHDFNHHLQTVYGLLEVGSCYKACDYAKQIFLGIANPAVKRFFRCIYRIKEAGEVIVDLKLAGVIAIHMTQATG